MSGKKLGNEMWGWIEGFYKNIFFKKALFIIHFKAANLLQSFSHIQKSSNARHMEKIN